MKHTTLSLLVVILKRAQNAAGYLASLPHHRNAASLSPDPPLLQQFREEVVKALPDVTTIISLRQNLASGKAKAESQEEGMCANNNQDFLNVIIFYNNNY